MCESAKDIQLQWNFKCEDYIFDPADGEARVWFGYSSKEEIIGLPRKDQLQEICMNSYIHNLRMSMDEAFFHFLEWYATCLKKAMIRDATLE
jgi:hypothetical protein